MYKKYFRQYYNRAKLGLSLKTYLFAIKNFSIYVKLMPDDSLSCRVVNSFFSNRKITNWSVFLDLPRNYLFNYVSASCVLAYTRFKNFFLLEPIPECINEKEFLTFTGDPAEKLLKDFIEGKHFNDLAYYKWLVKIINSKRTTLSLTDVYFLVIFSAVFSKEELHNLISKIEFLYHYNNLKKDGMHDLLVLMFLIGEEYYLEYQKSDIKNILLNFGDLSFDSQFILLCLLYKGEQ